MKDNVFVRTWKKICNFFKKLGKYCKDTVGELKKVVWTPKSEVAKSSKVVIISVLVICVVIAIIDVCFSLAINSLAGLVG